MFTDEAIFSRSAIQNSCVDERKVHATAKTHFQEHFSVNIYGGIIGNYFIENFSPERLDGQIYLHFLREELPVLLEVVTIALRSEM